MTKVEIAGKLSMNVDLSEGIVLLQYIKLLKMTLLPLGGTLPLLLFFS